MIDPASRYPPIGVNSEQDIDHALQPRALGGLGIIAIANAATNPFGMASKTSPASSAPAPAFAKVSAEVQPGSD